jgi:cytochrome d ubiquinol oxidase subunit I
MGQHEVQAGVALRIGIIAGLLACVLQLFPTGDQLGRLLARYQAPTLAAMVGRFVSGSHAELALIGQPDVPNRRLENPIMVPAVLSFLAYGSFGADVRGLNDVPQDQWPDNIELLYFSYHIMVGLGTILCTPPDSAGSICH